MIIESSVPDRRNLNLSARNTDEEFLSSLEFWQTLGLMTDEQLLQFCETSLSCPLFLSLPTRFSNPNILIGLEQWLTQGAVSENQVLSWCQLHLSEPLPEVALTPISQSIEIPDPSLQSTAPSQTSSKSALRGDWVPRILQSLMDEISVLWLLFLGVFLVVVSSAVLAASQWNTVSAAGQYGILWAYTFAFWGASHWLGRREDLQLTAHTLQLTALLIIPVNFWMIDSFQLVQGGLSLLVAGVAGVILSGLMAYTLNPGNRDRWGSERPEKKRGWIVLLNLLLLSWLHWGWLKDGVAPIAIYVGIIATACCTVLLHSEPLETVRARPPNRYPFVALLALTPLYGMLLLLLRGVWIAQLPIESLSLAFGLVGGIFCWTGRRPMLGASSWWIVGFLCLIFARLNTQEFDSHFQAVLITAIALWALGDRLVRSWHPGWVWLMFTTGLLGLYPLYSLVPVPVQDLILAKVAAIAGTAGHQSAVLSFMVLPYWWLTLRASDILRQWQWTQSGRHPSKLVPLLERIALVLGGFLTLFTLENPLLRTVFLICVGITLFIRFCRQESPSPVFMGIIHSVGLGAIASGIDYCVPNMTSSTWAMVCLIGMIGEFAGVAYGAVRWKQIFWWAGLTLATISYLVILNGPYSDALNRQHHPLDTIMAWAIPAGLTGLGCLKSFQEQKLAQSLGIISIFAVQFLCIPFIIPRAVGFGLATVLMCLLSLVMRRSFAAIATIGFGIGFGINLFDTAVPSHFDDWYCVLLPLISLVVTTISSVLRQKRVSLAVVYRRAAYGWSTFINVSLVIGLWALVLTSFSLENWVSSPMQIGAGLTVLATLYQLWRWPNARALYLVALAVEGCICLLAWLGNEPYELMAMGTIIAGLVAFFCKRNHPKIESRHWDLVPVLFAGTGVLIGHHGFQAHTGLYTMGAALIPLLVSRRRQEFKGGIYLGMAALSFGLYELLVYQILQSGGDHPGDALVLLAGLATLVALGDRLLVRWSNRLFKLAPEQFFTVAHFHWLTASIFLGMALVAPMQGWAEITWLVLMLILTAYAMTAGKIQSGFLYAGIAQGLGAIAFGLAQRLPLSTLGHWGGAIAVVFAAGLYYFPWSQYKWEPLPGQKMAMILPAGVITLSLPTVGLSSLLLSGAWYFWVSQRPNLLRLSYLGLAFGNWAVFRLVDRWLEVTPMWIAVLLGCSLLLVVQWEPVLQSSQRREIRHWLRSLALGLMALVALYESDGLLGWSLATVFAGLMLGVGGLILRVRSCLYVGTVLFLVKVIWMLWTFVADHSLVLWAMGIVLGVLLIWVAATFESRRAQAIAFLDYWVDELQHWQ